jgi:hypothetical protein
MTSIMKTKTNHNKTRAQMLGLCLNAFTTLASLAQTPANWETVLNYQYPGGTAEGHRVVADASGNVFTAGDGSDASGITRGIVLQTDTTQANWFLSDDTIQAACSCSRMSTRTVSISFRFGSRTGRVGPD